MLRRLLHFLLLGSALFALEQAAGPAAPEPETIAIRLEPLRARFAAREGRPPLPEELRALVRDAADEEILLHTALAIGSHRSDPVVRRHLVRNLRFVGTVPSGDDDALLEEAFALGMERTDPVARRRLVFIAERVLRAAGRGEEPSEDDLRRHLEANRERFRREPRLRFTHVFLSAARRGDALGSDAARLLEALRREDPPDAEAISRGDPWLLAHALPLSPVRDVTRTFGRPFAETLLEVPIGKWSGPLRTAHGLHLVRVDEREPGENPTLEAVRDRVRYSLYAKREEEALRAGLSRLRERYRVRIVDGGGGGA